MFSMKRKGLVTAWGVLLAVAVSAVAWSDRFEERKRHVVRAALANQGRAVADSVLLRSVARAEALLGIELDASDSTTLLTLRSTGHPICEAFILDHENKLVIDLYNTVNFCAGEELVPERPALIRQVRTSLFAFEPQFISRVVVDLAAPCAFAMAQDDRQITIDLIATDRADPSRPALAAAMEQAAQALACRKVRVQIALACLEEVEQRTMDAIEEHGVALAQGQAGCNAVQTNGGQTAAVPAGLDKARSLFECLVAEQQQAHEQIRERSRVYGERMARRIGSLEAGLERLRTEVDNNETNETEAWAALQIHQEGVARAEREDAELFEDIRAHHTARREALSDGFNALDLMLVDTNEHIASSPTKAGPAAPEAANLADGLDKPDEALARLDEAIDQFRLAQPAPLAEPDPARAMTSRSSPRRLGRPWGRSRPGPPPPPRGRTGDSGICWPAQAGNSSAYRSPRRRTHRHPWRRRRSRRLSPNRNACDRCLSHGTRRPPSRCRGRPPPCSVVSQS